MNISSVSFMIHWSATALNPLTSKVYVIDHLVTIQCLAGKPAFMAMALPDGSGPSNRKVCPAAPEYCQRIAQGT